MALGDLAHQAQAQAHSPRELSVASQAVKGIEDAIALALGHARAAVADGQQERLPLAAQLQRDGATTAVALGVLQQIAQGAAEQALIDGLWLKRKFWRHLDLGLHPQRFLSGQTQQIRGRAVDGLARIDATGQQDLLHQGVELLDVAVDFSLHLRLALRAGIGHHGDRHFEAGQR